MKKLFVYILLVLVLPSFIKDKGKVTHHYSDKSYTYTYETQDGRIDGNYISYYKNGKIRAKGNFINNYRNGVWSVWDSTDKYYTERVYENPFVFKRTKPTLPKNKLVDLVNKPIYTIKYNEQGFINMFYLQERAVYWEKRLWRLLPRVSNDILFADNTLFNIIYRNASNDGIKVYKDDEFRTELNYSKLKLDSKQIIAYKIKEDAFFDTDRFVYENRIIGICPVAIDKTTKDTTDLYWVYYPQLRKHLAKVPAQKLKVPANIRTYDDLFFYRYFSSRIYKMRSVVDLEENSEKEPSINTEAIEMSLIETEHDLWLKFIK